MRCVTSRLGRRQVHDEAKRPAGTGFAAGLDEVVLGTLVQILLAERRGIERVEQLTYLPQPDLDERMVALAPVCGYSDATVYFLHMIRSSATRRDSDVATMLQENLF